MIRAFLGIPLPATVRAALSIQQFLLPLPRKVEPEAMHLTLVFLGACRPEALEAAHDGFGALMDRRFSLRLEGLGLFGGDRPRAAWAGVAASPALTALQARLDHIARRAGCPVEARRFVPHVTLGRFTPPPFPDAIRLERAVALGGGFTSDPWEVTELVLWRSDLGPKGSRYTALAEYPLA